MSTDKDNHKSDEMKVEEKGDAKADVKKAEANNVDDEGKKVNDDKSSDNESDPEPNKEKEKVKKESPRKSASKAKEPKKEEKSEDVDDNIGDIDDDDDEEEEAEENDEKPKKADKDVPLLDQPLQVTGARERKKVERFNVEKGEEMSAVEIPEGKGVSLGNIGVIENNISKTKSDDLKKFHFLLFARQGKATLIKKNIRKFNGFDFEKGTEQYDRKKASLTKIDPKYMKDMIGILDLAQGGSRDDQVVRVLEFLMEPKGSDAPAPVVTKGGLTKGGRPKRSAATKANNKGYSDGSDEDDEDRTPRSRRANKGKRPNLKDESSSDDEKVKEEEENEEKGSDIDILPDEETPTSDESDDPKSKKKRAAAPKAAAKKSKKKSIPAKKEKVAPKKRKAESEEQDQSSEDDRPLVKKIKTPPTDEDIKTYVKEILEGANLEEITMKTVCKQVYGHYPEFDLAHKKDFIKTTVKSLIST